MLNDTAKPVYNSTKNGKYAADLTVLTSSYAKSEFNKKGDKAADQYLINNSRMLYVNPDKKITDNWLKSLGLHLPSDITNYGYVNKIADFGDNVKLKNSTMADALKKAQVKKNDTRYSLSDSKTDAEYDKAVKSGDTETAQRLVDEAAKNAGYTVKAYHGTKSNFNVFDANRTGENYSGWSATGKSFDFSKDEHSAILVERYGKTGV